MSATTVKHSANGTAAVMQTPPPEPRQAPSTRRHVLDLWDDAVANGMSPLGRLVYRSNILGADQRVTNTGGGNTSSKLTELDPMTGDPVEVLWVKGSGGDLRTSEAGDFSSLYQDRLQALKGLYADQPERGPKTPAEDRMVGLYAHCTFNLNPRPSSIDTPLHAFLPARHVDHTHPVAPIAIAASRNAEALTRQVYGDDVAYVRWIRPGFELGLEMEAIAAANPAAHGIIMGQHGLINWADDDRECYDRTLDLIERAALFIEQRYEARGGHAAAFGGALHQSLSPAAREKVLSRLMPWLRGQLSAGGSRVIGTAHHEEATLRFVNSRDAARLAEVGTSCPDHFLRTKIKPLYVSPAGGPVAAVDAGDEAGINALVARLREALTEALPKYRADYAAYYDRCRRPDSPAMRDASPTVILLPGVGLVAWGKSKSESRVTAEFYNCAIEVMRGAETIDEYVGLPQQEAFDIEYWLLEEAKLRRMPAEKELARRVAVVVGAGSGIGREVVHRLVREGACVVAVDLNTATAEATAKEVTDRLGHGIGVAGTGVSACGDAIGFACDITDRASVRAMLRNVALAYGGFDSVVVTAGVFVAPGADGTIADSKWDFTFAVNVKGSFLVADEARTLWEEQGLKGSLVLTTSANAVVAKKGSMAYDTSKAAANHLVRELAVELSPLVRVNGVAPAAVVEGSSMFPRDRVVASLVKYNLAAEDSETDDELRTKLARFYADRTLTKEPVTPADQAEAYFLLITGRLGKTTGQIVPVDGGLDQAFMR